MLEVNVIKRIREHATIINRETKEEFVIVDLNYHRERATIENSYGYDETVTFDELRSKYLYK